MSSFRRSSQPGSPTSQADSLLAGLPGKPLVYTLFVYTLIQKTLIEKVEFYWPSYLCNHGSRLCVSLLLSFHFLRSKSQCSGFSAWRLTRTDCDTLSADMALPSLCSPGGWGTAAWRPSVHVSGVVGALRCLTYSPWPVPRRQVTPGLYKLASCPSRHESSWVARVKAVKSRKPGFCLKFQNVWLWGLCQISSASSLKLGLLLHEKTNHNYFIELP